MASINSLAYRACGSRDCLGAVRLPGTFRRIPCRLAKCDK